MSKDLKDSVKEVSEKFEAAVDQGKEKLKDTADTAKDDFHDLQSKARDHLDHFQDKAEDFATTAEDEFNRLYGEEGKLESLVNFVRDRPVFSLGITAVAVVFVIKLLKCCRSKHR